MHDQKSKLPELINNLARNLGNAVVFKYKAQGHHWNVEGMKFHMLHEFFGLIYEDVEESIDPMAENILKCGSKAPFRLIEFAKYSAIEDSPVCENAYDMLKDLYDSNAIFINSLNEGIELAEGCNEYGVADFLVQRVDMHKKWQWQIKSHLKEAKVY